MGDDGVLRAVVAHGEGEEVPEGRGGQGLDGLRLKRRIAALQGDIPEYAFPAQFDDIESNDFSLVPSKYIKFATQDNQEDYETRMRALQEDMSEILREEDASRSQIISLFEDLGFKLKID